ncbi:MAG: phospholipase D-like domain-containing protein [Anaerolineales bacterium]|nr:phospholipase D-like domain-containing protein [Anaerolineales bacterium]
MDKNNRYLVRGLIFCLIILSACGPEPVSWLDPVPSTTPARFSSPNQLLSVYFTAIANDNFRGGPDRLLADSLDDARYQIDAALYDLNLWTIRNAMIRAHERGVIVRVVVEEDSLDRPEIQELIDAGIPIVSDQAEGLMHNKFIVIDQSEVWTGSMNMTVNGAYRHLNNLVRIRSTLVAENYTSEFEEMFLDGFFGEIILDNTPHPVISIDNIQMETYFSPDDSTAERIIELILEADQSIDFMFYSFTSDAIADALIYQASQGIIIRGVMDAYQERSGLGSEYEKLRDQNLEVFLDRYSEKMHHKVIILDNRIVVTGSYNLTRSAETINDENTLVIHSEEVAEIYLNEFEWIFSDAKPH